MLNEANIIDILKSSFPKYIGDDAAVIKQNNNQSYIISKDLFIENVHFRTRYFNPTDLANKALHINLSDIASMGAKAQFALLGLAIPSFMYITICLSKMYAMCIQFYSKLKMVINY